MSWFPVFKLGPLGLEVGLRMQVAAVMSSMKNVEQIAENILGDKRRTILKMNVPQIAISFTAMPNETFYKIEGFRQSLDVMNLLMSDAFKVRYQFLTAASTTLVILPNTSATGITIDGVFLRSDTNRTGTNYFSGGSFDPATFKITLGSALPSANEPIFVDYSFTGHKVMVTTFDPQPHDADSKDLWRGKLVLEGA